MQKSVGCEDPPLEVPKVAVFSNVKRFGPKFFGPLQRNIKRERESRLLTHFLTSKLFCNILSLQYIITCNILSLQSPTRVSFYLPLFSFSLYKICLIVETSLLWLPGLFVSYKKYRAKLYLYARASCETAGFSVTRRMSNVKLLSCG